MMEHWRVLYTFKKIIKDETEKKVEAIIFDWVGIIVDFGSSAFTQVFVEAFSEFGINISLIEFRGSM